MKLRHVGPDLRGRSTGSQGGELTPDGGVGRGLRPCQQWREGRYRDDCRRNAGFLCPCRCGVFELLGELLVVPEGLKEVGDLVKQEKANSLVHLDSTKLMD